MIRRAAHFRKNAGNAIHNLHQFRHRLPDDDDCPGRNVRYLFFLPQQKYRPPRHPADSSDTLI